jgi:hypothetical protein
VRTRAQQITADRVPTARAWKDCDALRTIRGKAAENCGFAPRRLIAAIDNDFL